jgi:hypothetical protein
MTTILKGVERELTKVEVQEFRKHSEEVKALHDKARDASRKYGIEESWECAKCKKRFTGKSTMDNGPYWQVCQNCSDLSVRELILTPLDTFDFIAKLKTGSGVVGGNEVRDIGILGSDGKELFSINNDGGTIHIICDGLDNRLVRMYDGEHFINNKFKLELGKKK